MNEHAVAARKRLDLATEAEGDGNDAQAEIDVQRALAEATLALAEEQRIANLIAHRAYIRGYLLDTRMLSDPRREALVPILAVESGELGDRIRHALDLSPTHRTKLQAACEVDEHFLP